MKMRAFVLAAVAMQSAAQAQSGEISVEPGIREVTVYTSGARLFCEKTVEIPAGTTQVRFTGIPAELDPGSIQVSASGPVTILTVNHELDYLTDPEKSGVIRELEKKRDALKKKVDKEKMQLQILDKEEQFLTANMKVTGTQATTKVAELTELHNYFSGQVKEIVTGRQWRNDSILSWNLQIERIGKQIGDLQSEQKKPGGVLAVSVEAAAKTVVPFRISFVIPTAGWFPSYDLRVSGIDAPVRLTYKANLFQRSGIDWKEVTLRFSSASAYRTGVLPELTPWWVDFLAEHPVRLRGAKSENDIMYMKVAEARDEAPVQASLPLGMTTREQLTAVEFLMEKPMTVPASGKNLMVDVQTVSLPAEYSYLSVPKLDPSAHLKAKLTGWEQYNLLAGEANIYYEGAFTGKTFLNMADFADTLEISLGIDPNLSVQRTLEKEHSATRFLSSKTEVTRSWKLSVRNNKAQIIRITLLDQVPMPANSDIEVTNLQLSGGKQDGDTGRVTWELEIKPAERVEKVLSYTLRYPKGKKINID